VTELAWVLLIWFLVGLAEYHDLVTWEDRVYRETAKDLNFGRNCRCD
jgi:hypothetical protein